MPIASMRPHDGRMPRPVIAPAMAVMPASMTYQPSQKERTSRVGDGHAQTMRPTANSRRPAAIDQPRLDPSSGTVKAVDSPVEHEDGAEEDGEVAKAPVGEQDDPPGDDADDAAQGKDPPAAGAAIEVVREAERVGDEHGGSVALEVRNG